MAKIFIFKYYFFLILLSIFMISCLSSCPSKEPFMTEAYFLVTDLSDTDRDIANNDYYKIYIADDDDLGFGFNNIIKIESKSTNEFIIQSINIKNIYKGNDITETNNSYDNKLLPYFFTNTKQSLEYRFYINNQEGIIEKKENEIINVQLEVMLLINNITNNYQKAYIKHTKKGMVPSLM